MGLRDLVKKKDRLGEGDGRYSETLNRLAGPEFTFIRSDTNTHEIIYPPAHPASKDRYLSAHGPASPPSKTRRSLDVFRPRSRGNSLLSVASGDSDGDNNSATKKEHRRLSQRLGLSRHPPKTSEFVPEDLPQINVTSTSDDPTATESKEAREHQWEKRATILASTNEERQRSRSRSVSASPSVSSANLVGLDSGNTDTSPLKSSGVVSSKEIDQDIQEAIRLHEEGDLERSTQLFGRLADPYGANNPLSQVLYGLALRHGWGCEPDLKRAVTYLSAAASNAATVETMALKAGLKKGGAAKGELVLAIFELANCFRHGWGIAKDPVAAKQYYETAANLGDTDAMNEAAWCYLEGFGCKKDKFQAAQYYRLAEKSGSKTLGNTWIWKDKYNPK
ncbi:HCP-like protein [Xylaria bambusicola]|uniref:HCP-like protein n=1 Tax=Xylaria bambusicola TaxID=326684 RepID=UPI0020085EE0|nr:HCP-like protein [Xylaria bambusicola]KAI0508588.1 HCP-like protein [Xylaria bambusicola]